MQPGDNTNPTPSSAPEDGDSKEVTVNINEQPQPQPPVFGAPSPVARDVSFASEPSSAAGTSRPGFDGPQPFTSPQTPPAPDPYAPQPTISSEVPPAAPGFGQTPPPPSPGAQPGFGQPIGPSGSAPGMGPQPQPYGPPEGAGVPPQPAFDINSIPTSTPPAKTGPKKSTFFLLMGAAIALIIAVLVLVFTKK